MVRKFFLLILLSLSSLAFAGNKGLLTVEGSMTDSANVPVNGTASTVVATVLAPSGCLLWSETFSSVTLTNGGFVLSLGGGSNSAPGSLTWNQIFQNGVSLGAGSLTGSGCSGTYNGSATDDRTLYLSFNGGPFSTAQMSPAIALKANPQNPLLGGYPVQLASGVPTSGQVLSFDAANNWWAPTAAGSGVTNVTSSSTDISIATSTTTPLLTLNTGTGANQIVKLNGSAQLPAVSGANLTNLSPTALSGIVSVINGGTGLNASTASNGQLLIGNGSGFSLGSLIAGTGITITPAAGSVTIASSGSAPTGSAGGDLSGTYPNPTVGKINGTTVAGVGVGLNNLLMATSALSANQALVVNGTDTGIIGVTGTSGNYLRANASGVWSSATIPATDIVTALGYTPVNKAGDTMAGSSSSPVLTVTQSGTGPSAVFSGGKVGIGTAAPATALDVVGAVRFAMDSATCVPAMAGAQRFNSPNMEFCNGTIWSAYGVSGAGVTSIIAGTGLSGGTITTSGTISLPNVGTSGTYGTSTSIPVITVDAQGRVSGVSVQAITGAPPTGTASGDLAGTYPSPTVNAVSTNTFNSIVRRDGAGGFVAGNISHPSGNGEVYSGSTGTVTLMGPTGSIGTSYPLRLPASQGSFGQVMQNDGSGNFTWMTPIASGAAAGGNLSGTYPNPTVNAVGSTTAAQIAGAVLAVNNATNANISSTLMLRDSGGYFSASGVTMSVIYSPSTLTIYGGNGGEQPVAINDNVADSPVSIGNLVVEGQITNPTHANATTHLDFNTSTIQYTSASCGASILDNMKDGATYTVVFQGSTSGTCTFTDTASARTFRFSPANGPTAAGSHTIYTMQVIGTNVYVSWITGL